MEKVSASVLVLSDVGSLTDYGQLSFLDIVLVRLFVQNYIFYTINWMNHKLKRLGRSIGAVERTAALEAIDEGKTLKRTLSTVYQSGSILSLHWIRVFCSRRCVPHENQFTSLAELVSLSSDLSTKLETLMESSAFLVKSILLILERSLIVYRLKQCYK